MIGKAVLALLGILPVSKPFDSRIGAARAKAQKAMSMHRDTAAQAQRTVLDLVEQSALDPRPVEMRAHNDHVRGMLAGLMKSMEAEK